MLNWIGNYRCNCFPNPHRISKHIICLRFPKSYTDTIIPSAEYPDHFVLILTLVKKHSIGIHISPSVFHVKTNPFINSTSSYIWAAFLLLGSKFTQSMVQNLPRGIAQWLLPPRNQLCYALSQENLVSFTLESKDA